MRHEPGEGGASDNVGCSSKHDARPPTVISYARPGALDAFRCALRGIGTYDCGSRTRPGESKHLGCIRTRRDRFVGALISVRHIAAGSILQSDQPVVTGFKFVGATYVGVKYPVVTRAITHQRRVLRDNQGEKARQSG